jgi:uncharacterized protein (DUF885 family)
VRALLSSALMKRSPFALAGAALALTLGCGPEPTPKLPPPTSAIPTDAPVAVVKEERPGGASFEPELYRTAIAQSLEAYFVARPTSASRVGEHRFDSQWPDVTQAGAARVADDFRARAQGLRTIAAAAPETASQADAETDRPRLDALLLADALEADAFDAKVVRPPERDPSWILGVIGLGVSSLTSHAYAPAHDRLNALDERLAQVPALLKAARERIKTPVRAGVENMLIGAGALAKSLRDGYANVDAKDLAGDVALKARLKKNADAAAAALDAYSADVAKAFPPASLQNAGIGAEAWSTLARLRDGVGESPADVRKMGEAEITRLTADLDKVLAESGKPGETRAKLVARMQEDTPKPDKVLEDYRAANKGVEEWLRGHKFVTVPWDKAKLTIVQSPPHKRGTSFASLNAAGPLDAVSDAQFEVNTPDPSMPPERRAGLLHFHAHGALENVSIHEAIPGHYLHSLHIRDAGSKVRKVFWSAATGEGWAHYCEQAMIDEGYVTADPVRMRVFYLRSALQRAARVVIDVGLHDGTLTFDQAVKVLEDNALLSTEAAKIEVRRGVTSPSNMFSYAYGKLAIMRLRERVKAKEKERFDLVSFHDRFLSMGAIPIKYIGPAAFGVE